ncbi:transposase [Salibacterium halotolerans]|uniref:Transposase n=1 Tax=Salibacterium halotolerans TaxID=1884432 RepID=A0A1I5LBF0_9BACI|nr:transposase [Salibacterium halotolerans]SFO94051.1 transposase [Salibacterium halotolerans]
MEARFTEDQKYRAVQGYLSGGFSYQDVADKFGADKRSIRMWVALYQEHGRPALAPWDHCYSYSSSFKMDVVQYRWRTKTSYFRTAVIFNLVSQHTDRKGENVLFHEDSEAFLQPEKEYADMTKKPDNRSREELQEENERLELENAYLKKLHAFVQQKKSNKRRPNAGGRRTKEGISLAFAASSFKGCRPEAEHVLCGSEPAPAA